MTVVDIAIAANVSRRTVSRKANELFPGKLSNGHRTTFSKDEAVKIMSELRKPGFVSLGQPGQPGQVPGQSVQVPKRTLPSGAQLHELLQAVKAKVISAVQFQEAIGVTVERPSRQLLLIETGPQANPAEVEAGPRQTIRSVEARKS